jgi:conjugative relaxase-like TrwC/TraI family protein
MMTVHKVGPADVVGYADYLASADEEAKRRGDYYLGPDGAASQCTGRWHGKAAAELGLSGAVARDDMLRMWEGRDPRTGDVLIRRGQDGHHVAAVDCTFSAPKSVSVVWGLADAPMRAAIEVAQDQAVAVALDHIERNAPLVRRRIDGQITHEVAGGIAVARFRHHTSRLSAEQYARGVAPDPQLHDHCALANLAVRTEGAHAANGKWAAIDSRELFRIAQEAGAVYRAELAAGLIELGYSIVRSGRFFELSGVPARAREAFSARHREVQQAVRQFLLVHGRAPSYVETRGLVMLTRNAKAQEHEPAFAQWDERARAAGIDPADVRTLHHRAQADDAVPIPTSWDDVFRDVVAELTDPDSPYALTREAAAVDERAVRIAVADAAQGRVRGAYVDGLRAMVERSPELVRLDAAHWTTRPMIEMEQAVLADARVRLFGRWYGTTRASRDAAIAGARVALSVEQEQAVVRLCAGGGLILLTAPAGAGKGEVLRVVATAHQADGYTVIAVAAAGETAQRLGADVGADATMTVDALSRRGSVPPDSVVIVDEAALLETNRWFGLLMAASGARVIAAGDPAQLSPIEAGGMWPQLERRAPVVRLSENYRARDAWARDAWTALRAGQSVEALAAFEKRGRIIVSTTRAESRWTAVELWDRDRHVGAVHGHPVTDYLLAVDGSNAEVDELNALAQARRHNAGELHGDPVTVTAARRTRPDELRQESLYVGDAVTFTRRFYPPRVRVGGAVLGGRRVENGKRGVVAQTDARTGSVTVRLGGPSPRQVTVGRHDLDALRLGYAQHVYPAMGRTVERVYVVTGGWQTDRESAYVGVSRARDGSFVFADYSSLDVEHGNRAAALDELAQRCAASKPKVAALSLAEAAGDEAPRASLWNDAPRAPARAMEPAPIRHSVPPPYQPPMGPSMGGPTMGI